MEYFNNDLFKEKSKVTYVYVVGRLLPALSKEDYNYNSNGDKYIGYIEVPYSYTDFIRFTPKQQRAICQAVFCKNGICIKFSSDPDPDKFFQE